MIPSVYHESVVCLIIGGGIGGAVLAVTLGQHGKRVVLLERALQPPLTARPELLARSTIETFERLGLGADMLNETAMPLQHLELWHTRGKRLLHFSHEHFRHAGTQMYSTDPARTRTLLLEAAATHSVAVHRGVDVHELVREGNRVVGVQALRNGTPCVWRAPLIVGDDGGQSRLRAALGIPLRLREFALEFLAAAGPALPGQIEGTGQGWFDPHAIRYGLVGGIFMPLPGRRSAFVFLLSSSAHQRFAQASPERFYDAAARLSPRCEGLAQQYRFPDDFTHIRRPFGHAPRYVDEGVALIGDAAHPVTPAGGQGANASVADAVALGAVALDALDHADCSIARLRAYEIIRRPANARSLRFSHRADWTFRALFAWPRLASLVLWALERLDRSDATKERLIRALSQAFVSGGTHDG
jgi:2-polyprenyl-6-methoxyphenol hydroxylase-like FAD-dependent oxidoreductase